MRSTHTPTRFVHPSFCEVLTSPLSAKEGARPGFLAIGAISSPSILRCALYHHIARCTYTTKPAESCHSHFAPARRSRYPSFHECKRLRLADIHLQQP